MSFKSSKIYIIISFFFLLNSCGLLRSDNRDINYKIVDFEENTPPEKPTYENVEDWLVHPQKDQKEYPFLDKNNGLMRADVFFIVPTLFTDKRNKNWNSDVYDNDFANTMMESTIKYQSTAWLDSGNLYSPNYRQAHYKVFDEFRWENGGKRAFELAYEDIKRSFEVYMQKYNEGRPIIIAGHSQGSGHAIRLLQDFFDGKKLKSKLIAAYLPGTRVTSNDFFDLELMSSPTQTGGYLTWNTYKIFKKDKKRNVTVDREWLMDAECSNPVTWNSSGTSTYSQHKGLLFLNEKIFSNALEIEYIQNGVFLRTPKIGLFKSLIISTLQDYHRGDINLFWEDIRLNAIIRVQEYFKNLAN